ncbi:MAG TPA: hypothetical protein VKU02_02155 [Gemmataceae bacterium]|nr:hypothetical protein [Gemmataceae bacterium]
MVARKTDPGTQSQEENPSGVGPQGSGKDSPPLSKSLPRTAGKLDTGQPGGGQGRVDVTGTMPEGIRVDPDITEGHPGYQESGDSEIIPTETGNRGHPSKEKRPQD